MSMSRSISDEIGDMKRSLVLLQAMEVNDPGCLMDCAGFISAGATAFRFLTLPETLPVFLAWVEKYDEQHVIDAEAVRSTAADFTAIARLLSSAVEAAENKGS